jgi:glutaminyl-peptide cyclotransferase
VVEGSFHIMKKNRMALWTVLQAGGLVLLLSGCASSAPKVFSGTQAYSLAQEFLQFGPRVSGTEANREAGDWILEELNESGWASFLDEGMYLDTAVRNIAGRRGQGPVIILGAHYDSRRCADRPQGDCAEPVLGANDGASGVAVLLELARTLDLDWKQNQIWLVFFDAEDNGYLNGWDWIAGSRQFALRVKDARAEGELFQTMILLDMVGDADIFIPDQKLIVLDDHVPFRDLGIPSVDIIDLNYPYWHTTGDTLDKISAISLERIGRTMEVWLEGGVAENS